MLRLHARLDYRWDADPVVLRIATDPNGNRQCREQEVFLVSPESGDLPQGFRAYFRVGAAVVGAHNSSNADARVCILPPELSYLSTGDIVVLSPRSGHLSVIYRRSSLCNSMLLTERCNSNCIMCSQPPKDIDDQYLVDTYLQAIPLMDPATLELGITGGEPTLLGRRLLDLLACCKSHLPQTAVHMLSNGRMFNYLQLCMDLAEVAHPDLVIGIPIYSDIAAEHDFVVQAKGAFDQTIRGIMNLERCGLRTEIRVVLHRHTISGLPRLASFIARNLPFVEHVALMGLEMMGYVRMNLDSLWIDPFDYQAELGEAVRLLDRHAMNVSIYNHQLCTLDRDLWPFARKSISDWKNEYLAVCSECDEREECGGLFSSGLAQHSAAYQSDSPKFRSPNGCP